MWIQPTYRESDSDMECCMLVMGDRLNFIIDHLLESVDAFDTILLIIFGSHIHWIKYFLCPWRKSRSIWFLPCLCFCPCGKGHNWFSFIILCKTYCQSSRRLSVSETSIPCSLVVHITLLIAWFMQASDELLLKMRIDHHSVPAGPK